MNETEIMKALEYCGKGLFGCTACPLFDYGDDAESCKRYVMSTALALINRKNAKIEKLNFENLQMVASIKGLKAEAIKEFAERVKALMKEIEFLEDWDIDQIAREMGAEL